MQIKEPILVTGATGFIGANLIHQLVSSGYGVYAVTHSNEIPWRLASVKAKVQLSIVDLCRKARVDMLINKIRPKTIFHLASYGNYSFQTDNEKILATNIWGTYYLIEACKKVGFDAFIQVGSSSEYGQKNKPMKETDLLEPNNFYAASKAAATFIAQIFSKNFLLPIVIVRPFSVYGPYEENKRFVPTIIRQLIKGDSIALTPSTAARDFIYITDVVEALLQLAQNLKKNVGDIVNIGTGKQYTNEEVVNTLFKVIGKHVEIGRNSYPNRQWDSPYWVANTRKAVRIFGWKSKTSLEQGLHKTYTWYLHNPHYE
jgi:nucleoside-diphosphate-sugar epimerase